MFGRKKHYVYFVMYTWNDDSRSGFGNCCADREQPIESIEDVREIEKEIRKGCLTPGFITMTNGKVQSIIDPESIVLMDYKLMRTYWK